MQNAVTDVQQSPEEVKLNPYPSGMPSKQSNNRKYSSSSREDSYKMNAQPQHSAHSSHTRGHIRRPTNANTAVVAPTSLGSHILRFTVVLITLVIAGGVGYGVYFLTTRISDDANSNNSTTFTPKIEIQMEGNDSEETIITLNNKVALNGPECGTLAPGVSSNLPSRRKRSTSDLLNNLFQGRIVGGNDANIEQHPWQVSLWTSGHTCGGSLVAPNWVVYAAHCTVPYPNAEDWTVYAGASTINQMRSTGQMARVTDLIVNSLFTTTTYDSDVALLRLDRDLVINDFVRTICLPPPTMFVPNGTLCEISGWGAKQEGGVLPNTLQEASVRIIDRNECNQDGWLMGLVNQHMVCAGTVDGSQDACQGDSGGPLACLDKTDNKYYLTGAVSWGIGCGEPYMPGVYTDMADMFTWITHNIETTEEKYSKR